MKKIDFLATDGIKLNGFLYEGKEKTNKIILITFVLIIEEVN